jgi:hypothetical protein
MQVQGPLPRTAGCQKCFSDLKVCRNCTFFDPSSHNQCREPQAEWCPEKDKANFCEFFSFSEIHGYGRPGLPGVGGGSDKDRARAAFDALFKKK